MNVPTADTMSGPDHASVDAEEPTEGNAESRLDDALSSNSFLPADEHARRTSSADRRMVVLGKLAKHPDTRMVQDEVLALLLSLCQLL